MQPDELRSIDEMSARRVGVYEIVAPLGAGGMGEVYRARDGTLGRDVAIKFLPPAFVHDPERVARFEREARVLASLNHPNIATVYGFEQDDHSRGSSYGGRALIMELVEGDTLAERIARGVARRPTIPLDETLAIARQIACALEAAHESGIVHRDLKPANIKVRPDGTVKVLDFGLAKAIAPPGGAGDSSTAPTVTLDGTRCGVILGTARYMSPEQARGEVVDLPTDVWAFGCVLYEMLTGRAPFARGGVTATLAAVLDSEPDWTPLPADTPAPIRRLLQRCLEKDVKRRLAHIREARVCIEDIAAHRARRHTVAMLPIVWVAAAALLLAGLLAGAWAIRANLGASPTKLAVLPFVNASGNPDDAYLAEGLADGLIDDLQVVPGVRVVSRTSATRYASAASQPMAAGAKGSSMAGGMSFMNDMPAGERGATMSMGGRKPLGDIAHELGAALLIDGTLSREGDRLVVTVAVIRAQPLQTLWQRTFSRPSHEVLALQRQLALAVSAAVGGGGSTPSDTAPRQYSAAAHDAYLKGTYYQAHWKLSQAVESFSRAVQLDPAHAGAQAGLSRAYYFLGFFGDLSPSVALAGMRKAATLALEHDPSMAEAHAQLALVKMLQDWDWDGAERAFHRALEISPANAQIRHDYAHFLLGQGRRRESMEQAREAVALDPVNPMLLSCLGWHSLFDARFDDAAKLAIEATELMPDHWAEVVLGWALLGQRNNDAAVMHMREAVRLKASPFTMSALAHALAVSGHPAEARRMLDSLLDRADREYVSPYDVATVYAGLGDADGTFKWLRRAADERSMFIVHVGWDFRLEPIRGDARLAQLTAREMRLPAPQFAALRALDRRGM